jgi:hypothetical protein
MNEHLLNAAMWGIVAPYALSYAPGNMAIKLGVLALVYSYTTDYLI